MTTRWMQDDGGRAAAGFKGEAGDCGTRAVAIATGLPYRQVYDRLGELTGEFGKGRSRAAKRVRGATARDGVFAPVMKRYLEAELGWTWTPTMTIGSGTTVHLRADELPEGRLIARCSKHFVAVIDGIVRDTHDSTRDGTRAVYGYWRPA